MCLSRIYKWRYVANTSNNTAEDIEHLRGMPPAKRKAPLRRQVLDLKGKDSSRPTWQTKYQNIQSEDMCQNGDPVVDSSDNTSYPVDVAKTNPLSGLVGSYNSDSDNEDSLEGQKNSLDAKVEDFLKEIQSLSSESGGTITAPSSNSQSQPENPQLSVLSKWQQCYDHNSGYPYYWNTETNEVTWEMPPDLEILATNVATKLHQTLPNQQHQQLPEASLPKEKKEVKKKVVCKYPWENESDSEDEKIEMITSFGPPSEEEDSEREESLKKSKAQKCKGTAKGLMVGPQLPPDSILVQYKKRISESDDTEAESLNDSSYETSCLLTYRVQDTGPPGDDGFFTNNETNTESDTKSSVDISSDIGCESTDNFSKKNSESSETLKNIAPSHSNMESHLDGSENSEKTLNEPSESDIVEKSEIRDFGMPEKYQENVLQNPCFDFADNVIAEIEKEMPPDYSTLNPKIDQNPRQIPSDNLLDNSIKVSNNTKASGISGIALLANYEDDSDPEEGSINEKRKGRDKKSNEKSIDKVIKPLFPCMDADAELNFKEPSSEKKTVDCETGKIYESEVNISDSYVMHKAFKRKKRIEFVTGAAGSSTLSEPKTANSEIFRFPASTQYNMDPTSNDHRGFGFPPATSMESNKSKSNTGWIQFVKTETINLNQDVEPKQKTELRIEGKQQDSEEDVIGSEEIEDAASLLKEKVTFLTEGKEEISPIQHIAIQLETLLIAWQQGALSNVYFFRWVKDKCSALIRHEKSAAPTGWTCSWDRKSKRYFYRNIATKVIQWDYPNTENEALASSTVNSKQTKECDPEGGGEEMELCLTPPHPSATEEDKVSNNLVLPSPGSVVTDIPRTEEVTLSTPVTSNSTSTCSERFRNTKSKNRKDLSTISEDDCDSKSTSTGSLSACTNSEKHKDVPPLPPMPPPPPPDEPPPPPPGSPPPLPLDHDQPLPPGVDEPEYGMFRRLSPRQGLAKSQVDAPSYGTDVIMTYGYAMQVQSSTPSVAAISLQPVDYRGYVHDHLNTNHYVVQTAPSHVIHCAAKKSKLSLSSELDSFYSDIAMLNKDSTAEKPPADVVTVQEPNSSVPVQTMQPVQRPISSSNLSTSVSSIKHTENVSSNGVAVKKKKKAKLIPGFSMKKKGVSSLVAKWKQVQQEVRRDLNSGDEEDEEASSINK